MTAIIENLWPDFTTDEIVRSPKIILREQASFLGKSTKNILTGNIRTESWRNQFSHSFQIVAPNLNNYTYTLFTIVEEDIFGFPCKFQSESAFSIKNEEELLARLKEIFSSDDTKKIINSLMSQSIENNVQVVK
jgi:hypothetical protein